MYLTRERELCIRSLVLTVTWHMLARKDAPSRSTGKNVYEPWQIQIPRPQPWLNMRWPTTVTSHGTKLRFWIPTPVWTKDVSWRHGIFIHGPTLWTGSLVMQMGKGQVGWRGDCCNVFWILNQSVYRMHVVCSLTWNLGGGCLVGVTVPFLQYIYIV